MNAIVCMNYDRGIGKNNKLLFHVKEDLERFKELTYGNVVVMGRKTFESLPNGALNNRINIVITRDQDFKSFEDIKASYKYRSFRMLDCENHTNDFSSYHVYKELHNEDHDRYKEDTDIIIINDIISACYIIDMLSILGKEVFVCGGQDIYEQLLPKCDTIYSSICVSKNNIESDRFFPEININEWDKTVAGCTDFTYNGNKLTMSFERLIRKR